MQEAKKSNPYSLPSRRNQLLIFVLVACFYGFLFCYFSNFSKLDFTSTPHFYSNQCRDDLKKIYLYAFASASKSLYLEMYGLSDKEVIALLNKKAEEGVYVRLRFDPGGSPKLLESLSRKVVAEPVVCRGLMHRKIAIIDEEMILLGSANLTSSSLLHHDNLVMTLHDKELASFIFNPQREGFVQELPHQKLLFHLLPEKKYLVSNQVLSALNTAKKTIKVAMFTLTHPTFIDALIAAKNRGVKVEVAIDYFTSQGASLKSVQKLSDAQIPLIFSAGKQLLHHKWALIDDQILIMGSANWTKSAFTKNEDFLLILTPLSLEQLEVLKRIWERIDAEKKVA